MSKYKNDRKHGQVGTQPMNFVNSDPKQSARMFIDKYDLYKKLLKWKWNRSECCYGKWHPLVIIPFQKESYAVSLREVFLKNFFPEGTFLNTFHLFDRKMKLIESIDTYVLDL